MAVQMYEFMKLQHKTFYMPHYAIGFFLDANHTPIPHGALEIKSEGCMAPIEPSILYWQHLDKGCALIGQKRKCQVFTFESEDDVTVFGRTRVRLLARVEVASKWLAVIARCLRERQ